MDDTHPDATCELCGRPVDFGSGIADAPSDEWYCSQGCREIDETLDGSIQTKGSDCSETSPPATESSPPRESDQQEQTFFRVDGMHSATCERYLESRATALDGVADATASYVTETVRVEHDNHVAQQDLIDALSTLGYDAYLRGDAAGSRQAEADAPLRSREMEGMRKRRSDEFLSFRYAAGVLFGAFLLLPYAVLVYPAHLADMVDTTFLELYENSFQLQGSSGALFLRLYLGFTGLVLLFTGLPVLRGAYASLRTKQPNTDLLVAFTVCSAYLYSTVAIIAGENDVFFDLTLVVAAAVTGAAFYETSIKQRALERLTDLTVSQVDEARRYSEDGTTHVVPVKEVTADDRVLVRTGERIPVDGTLVDQACTVDESIVTGESVPVRRSPGEDVLGGSIVTNDAALVEVNEARTSSIDRIMQSVWNIQSTDHRIQRRADRVATFVAPLLVLAALGIGAGIYVSTSSVASTILAMLGVFLVASPWALGLATPLSVASCLRMMMEHGIIVFDETIFERLREIDVVVFDKTGTLTTGSMEVLEANAPADLLQDVAMLERRASHPAAEAIVAAFGRSEDQADPTETDGAPDTIAEPESDPVSEFSSHATGITGTVTGPSVAVGSLDLFAAEDWIVSEEIEQRVNQARGFGHLPVIVGRDGRAEGVVIVGDEPREDWEETLNQLDERGVDVVVLTGDDAEAAEFFDRHTAVDQVFAGVPPAGKTETIRRLANDHNVAMVGDGTNDAPALAVADLGISLGSGTALAADAADIAISTDHLGAVETAFELAHAARSRIRQNNVLALCYNAITIPIAIIGLLNPVTVIFAAIVSAGLIGVNSSRRLLPNDKR
ncbi:cation-translocating P-type ATPase [Saliphagus sp. LR7]|uniref:heavy metal translocating P-type ATPase n=1 Tax=Saliphagus sp. LR7 TaxID=2282654 RepID=UPI000DF7D335|nr:cation-translocating P-type ATPase [Saliphagus sp. LR7]